MTAKVQIKYGLLYTPGSGPERDDISHQLPNSQSISQYTRIPSHNNLQQNNQLAIGGRCSGDGQDSVRSFCLGLRHGKFPSSPWNTQVIVTLEDCPCLFFCFAIRSFRPLSYGSKSPKSSVLLLLQHIQKGAEVIDDKQDLTNTCEAFASSH